MGYEISGAWGAKMAMPDREVIVFLGDGSYMMMNSDLYSSVLTGHKLIVIVCDNGGFAVIHRLQVNQGGAGYNNLFTDTRHKELVDIDFAAHARSMGCEAETVTTVAELEAAFERRARGRAHVRDRASRPHRTTGPRAARSGRSACRRSAAAKPCSTPTSGWSRASKRSGSSERGSRRSDQ